MIKVTINDKFGERKAWVMTTCPNFKQLTASMEVAAKVPRRPRIRIHGSEFRGVAQAAKSLGLSEYIVSKRVKSDLDPWVKWERLP